MNDGRTTVFLSFHRTEDVSAFAAFAARVRANASAAPGFGAWQQSVLTSPLLEQAIAVSFRDEHSAHEWLDQAGSVLAGQGFLRASLELFTNDTPHSPGVLLVREVAQPGQESSFVTTAEQLAELERARPGYEGSSLFPPADGEDVWVSVIRFRTEEHVNSWLASPELSGAIPAREALLTESSQVTTAHSFGSSVQVTDGQVAVTPSWKTALTIQLVLYPTVLLLNRFLNPILAALLPQVWLMMFVNLAVGLVLLTWVLMPLAGRVLGRWLDPVAGSGLRVSVLGTLAVCAGYVVCFAIFGNVEFLQFWRQ